MENYGGLTLIGENYADFGNSATIIGDVNGDGFADIAVQAPGADNPDPNNNDRGAVYVVFGSDTLPGAIDVNTLDGTNGFRIQPDTSLSEFSNFFSGYSFGQEIVGLGDVNGDGIDDFAISQRSEGGGFYGNSFPADVAHVILGGQNWQAVEQVEDLAGFRIDVAGRISSIEALGDINGDGFSEVGVNAFDRGEENAQVYTVNYSYVYDADGNGVYNQYLYGTTDPSGDFFQTGTFELTRNASTGYVVFGTDQERVGDDPIATGDNNAVLLNVQTVPDDAPTTAETIVNTSQFDIDGDGFAIDTGGTLRQTSFPQFPYSNLGGDFAPYDGVGGQISGASDLNGDGLSEIFIREIGQFSDVLSNLGPNNEPLFQVVRSVTARDANGDATDFSVTFEPANPEIFTFAADSVILGEVRDTSSYPSVIGAGSTEIDFTGTPLNDPDQPGAVLGDVSGDDNFDDLAIAVFREGVPGTPADPNDPNSVPIPATDNQIGISIIPGNADGNPFAPAPANFITDTSNVISEGLIIGPPIDGGPIDPSNNEEVNLVPRTVGFNIGNFGQRGPFNYGYGGGDGGALGDVNGDGIDDFFIISGGAFRGYYEGPRDVLANIDGAPPGSTVGYIIFGQQDPIVGDIDLADSFGEAVNAADRLAFKVFGLDQLLGGTIQASGVGDVDGDGNNDIVFNSGGGGGEIGPFGPGGARVLFGGLDNLVEVDAFDGTEDGYIDIRNILLGATELNIEGAGFTSQFQSEGDSGTTLFQFEVTRNGDLTVPVTFDFDVTPSGFDPAEADDFVGGGFPSGVVTFANGASTATIDVEVAGDIEIEGSEEFTVTISNGVADDGSPVIINGNSTFGRIFNDDEPVRIFARNGSVEEGDEPGDARELVLRIERSGEVNVEVTVDFTVSASSATEDDFEAGALLAASGQQVLAAGQSVAEIRIPIEEDVQIEANESVFLNITGAALSGADAGANVPVVISDSFGVGTIINDDFPPQVLVNVDDTFELEGTGPGNGAVFTFQIERRGIDNDDATVTFSINGLPSPGGLPAFNAADIESITVDGTGVPVPSLPLAALEVDFAGAELTKEVVVVINPDSAIEPRERFELRVDDVSSAGGLSYELVNDFRSVTVLNDDGRPPVIPPGVEADVFGDPHIVTLDGLGYDFQAVGEYVLVETLDGAANPFQVQVRFEPLPGSDLVSVTTRMAVEVDGVVIELDALGADALLFDGVAATGIEAQIEVLNSAGGTDLVDFIFFDSNGDGESDVFLNTATGAYSIILNNLGDDANGVPITEFLEVKVMDGSLNICVFLSDTTGGNADNVRGLMGDADGDLTDDFQLRDGSAIPASEISTDADGTPSLSFDFLYGRGVFDGAGYAGSWRLDGAEREFTDVAPTFPTGFPVGVLTVDDLPADLLAQAEAAAIAAGLDPTEPAIFEAAVLDFALTGDDDFFEGALGLAADPEVNTTPDDTPALPLIVGVNSTSLGVDLAEGNLDAGGAPEQTGVEFNFYLIGETDEDVVITYQVGGDVNDDDILVDVDNPGVGMDRTVTITAGESSATDTVVFLGDLDTELDEVLSVSITGVSDVDAMIGAPSASAVFLNDDNNAPTATDNSYGVMEDGELVGNVLLDDTGAGADDDPDGDALTASVDTGPANGDLVLNPDGSFTYTPDADFFGEDSFTYLADDGAGGSATATVSIDVGPEDDAPVAVDDLFTGDEDNPIIGNLIAGSGQPDTDADDDDLIVTSITFEGAETLLNETGDTTIALNDGAELVANRAGDITLTGNGAFDGLTEQPALGGYDESVDGDLSDDNLAPTQIALPALGAFSLAAGQAGTPRDIDYLTVTVPEGSQLDSFVLDGYIENQPDGGAFLGIGTGPSLPGTRGGQGAGDLIGGILFDETEIGLDLLAAANGGSGTAGFTQPLAAGEYTFWFNQLGGTVNTFDATFNTSLVDGPAGEAVLSFEYTLEDETGLTDDGAFDIEVAGVNDAPVAGADVATTDENTDAIIIVLGNDSDPEDDPLSVVLGDTPDFGDVVVNPDGTVTYTPIPNFNGTDTFTYFAQDPFGAQSEETEVIVTVNDVPADIAAVDDLFTTDQDTSIIGNILDNDTTFGADPLFVAQLFDEAGTELDLTNGNDLAVGGTVAVGTDGAFFFDPDGDFDQLGATDSETITLTYVLSEAGGETDTGEVVITVDGVNDDPEITSAAAFTVVEETAFSEQLAATDVDTGDSVSFAITGGADQSDFSLTSDGVLTFAGGGAPDVDASGGSDQVFEVEVTASDGNGGEDIQTIEVTVENDPSDDDPGGENVVEGTDGVDFLRGSPEDEVFRPGAGFVDVMDLRSGGADTIEFGDETSNGLREFDYILGFDGANGDRLDLGGTAITQELNFFGRTFLFLEGDDDVILLFGVNDFDQDNWVL